MTMPLQRRCRSARPGTTTVEMAFILPLFLLFVFGLVDLGRGFMVNHLLTDAARAGCRRSVAGAKSNDDVTAVVDDLLSRLRISDYTTTIKVNGEVADVSTAMSEDEISVSIGVPVQKVTWLPFTRFMTGDVTGEFRLRHE
jgi:Flp pilus assembly protein TadG